MAESPRPRSNRTANSRRTTPRQRKKQHVIDVPVRLDLIMQERSQWVLRALSKCVVFGGIGAGLYFGGSIALTKFLYNNPEYNLAELNVETDGVLTPAAVIAASDLHLGVNIFNVDLGRAKARVEALPQVEQAQISRHVPHKIEIQVTERKPVAWVVPEHASATRDELVASGKSFLIDSHGILLQPGKTLPQDFHLPIIRNYSADHLTPGMEADGEEIKAALDLLHAHQESLIASRFQIQEIDLSKHYGLNVLGESGVQVMFGLEEMDKQLKRLDVYLQTLESHPQRLGTINLLAQRNIPVTFITEPTVQSAPEGTPAPEAPAAGANPVSGNKTKAPPLASKNKDKVKSKSHDNEKGHSRTHSHDDKPKAKEHAPAAAAARRAVPVKSPIQPFTTQVPPGSSR